MISDYTGLPDEDTFEPEAICRVCEDIHGKINCEECGTIFCEDCRPDGRYWSNRTTWVPPLLRDPNFRAKFDHHKGVLSGNLMINSCPFCPTSAQESRFESRLDLVLCEDEEEFKAAVAIVQKRKQWLLGLSTATYDDRGGKWCFPGGGIHRNEAPEKAAERECREETGVRCKSVGTAFRFGRDKPEVAFVHCKVNGTPRLDNNSEFTALGFFTVREMRGLKLYKNVKDLIKRVQSH